MNTQLTTIPARKLRRSGRPAVIPAPIAAAAERAARRFIEYFTAEIANPNTRQAYAQAVLRFLEWCEDRDRPLERIDPITWGRKAGVNAEAMRDLLGHESVKTTLDIYSHVDDQRAAAMAIEDYALGGKLLPLSVTPLAGDQELTH